MIGLSALGNPEIQKLAVQGSPKLLNAVGRVFGLGQAEQQALSQGKFPVWFWITSGLIVGAGLGIYVERTWPGKVFGGK